MPRTCTVCAHPEREAIDRALVSGEPSRQIAARYGSLSRPAIQRHGEHHIPARLLKAAEARELTDADQLKAELEAIKADMRRLKERAEEEGDYRTAMVGCDKALKALELQAKLLRLINEGSTINVLVSPEWLELRAVIVGALELHPEARRDVLRALESAGDGSAGR